MTVIIREDDTYRVLDKRPNEVRPYWETVIHDAEYRITEDGNLYVEGNVEQWDIFSRYKLPKGIKISDIDPKYVETEKTWHFFGKEVKIPKRGWVKLKKNKPVQITTSKFRLYHKEDQ